MNMLYVGWFLGIVWQEIPYIWHKDPNLALCVNYRGVMGGREEAQERRDICIIIADFLPDVSVGK